MHPGWAGLRGPCAPLSLFPTKSRRFAAKVLQSDFIHTAQGAPIYFETTDSFADLRQRFGGVIARARQALHWPASLVPTFVVDRGIHGAEFFEQAAADPTFHLSTWEKGFVAQPWQAAQVMGKTTITRCRNSSSDVRYYHFEYLERPWEKNPKLRQIVVQATDDRGRTIQVAILTDDFHRAAAAIIELMFKRWLQENDFKYLDDHDHFRKLTQAPGVIEVSAQQIVIHLLPRTNYGGELKKAVIQTLADLNAQGLDHPRLPGRKLKFRLGQRSEMELKMNPLP